MPVDANAAVDAVYRSDWGRIVATLIRLVRDFDVAEDAAQEAFTAAVDQWRVSGVPEFPRAWIIQTARHKAIDRIRRQTRFAEKLDAYTAAGASLTVEAPEFDPGDIPDDRLRVPRADRDDGAAARAGEGQDSRRGHSVHGPRHEGHAGPARRSVDGGL